MIRGVSVDVDRWAELHRARWPWCGWLGHPHDHTEQLINGRPAGRFVLEARVSGRRAGKVSALRHLEEHAEADRAAARAFPGWSGCGSPVAQVARMAEPRPLWPAGTMRAFDTISRAIRAAVLADVAAGRIHRHWRGWPE